MQPIPAREDAPGLSARQHYADLPPITQPSKLPRLSAFLRAHSSSSLSSTSSRSLSLSPITPAPAASPPPEANASPSKAPETPTVTQGAASSADSTLRCLYPGKRCDNLRTFKRGGGLHRLCAFHRARANRNQWYVDHRRRLQRQSSANTPTATPSTHKVKALPREVVRTTSLPPLFELIRPQTLAALAVSTSTSPLPSPPLLERRMLQQPPMQPPVVLNGWPVATSTPTPPAATAAAWSPSTAASERQRQVQAQVQAIARAQAHVQAQKQEASPVPVAVPVQVSTPTPVQAEMRCLYTGKRCENMRTLKRGGGLHRLCAFHRMRANDNQRHVDERRRIRREQERLTALDQRFSAGKMESVSDSDRMR